MSVLTAARTVLDDASEPVSADAIYRRMVERGLWRNPHLHPEATVAAAIESEIGKLGAASRFRIADQRKFTTISRGA
jgi:hypothetical protein